MLPVVRRELVRDVDAGREIPLFSRDPTGRGDRDRTCDIRFWRPALYQLSYTPVVEADAIRDLWGEFKAGHDKAGRGR
jgi:hypothetical protein